MKIAFLSINDLLYREYDKGVKLLANETMIINIPKFDKLENNDISIVIINNTNKSIEKTLEYNEEQSISYTADVTGVYTVYAIELDENGGESITNLKTDTSFGTEYSISDSNFIY